MADVPDLRSLLPDPSRPNRYVHRRPRRPSHLPKRLKPPPERPDAPDLTPFLYAGIVLVIILVVAAMPNLIAYVAEVLSP